MTTLSGPSSSSLPSAHPSYALLEPLLRASNSRTPASASASASAAAAAAAAPLFQTFNDLAHSARWTHLEPVDLADQPRPSSSPLSSSAALTLPPVLVGWKRDEKKATIVVPLRSTDRITPSLLAALFTAVHERLPNPYPFTTPPHGPTLLLPPQKAETQSAPAPAPAPPETYARVPLATDALTVAVLGPDGTVVYYHLAEGIRKPIN